MELKLCDSCKSATGTLFCRADSAFLCVNCDSKIHATNKLASRHARVWLCEVCEQAPAHVTCKADAAALCVTCDRDIHSANPLASRHERVPVTPFYELINFDRYYSDVDGEADVSWKEAEVSSTPSAKPARDQSLLALLDAKEVSIKGKRKIEPKAPSTSKPNKSPIWRHVQMEKDKDGKVLSVKCNYCERKKDYCPKQGTTVWINHFVRIHKDEWENIEKSAPKLPQMTTTENSKKHKKEGSGAKDPSNEVRTKVPSRKVVITDDDDEWIASPTHDISEETEATLVKGNNLYFDEQSDRENLNGWKFENHEFESCPSEKVVFTADDIAAGSKHWENALVGYVLGLKPTLADMTCFAKTEWERFEVLKVLLLDDGVFLFVFESPNMKRTVWESQWAYSDHLLILREWTSDLDVHNLEVLRRVPIWVEFPKLPLFLWNPKSLGRLARHLGKPLVTDKSTKNPQNQLKCPRVLIEVEVDTMDELPQSIPVDLPWKSFNQPVVFDRESVQNSCMASKNAGGTTGMVWKQRLEMTRISKEMAEIDQTTHLKATDKGIVMM